MNFHASTVMRLLEDLRRIEGGEDVSRKEGDYPAAGNPADEQARPPKRPWEDMARDGEPPAPIVHYDVSAVPLLLRCLFETQRQMAGRSPSSPHPHPDEQAQSTAEQDMQIIRNKRQSSTGGAAPGQQKNKYRKRSVRCFHLHLPRCIGLSLMDCCSGLPPRASAIPATFVKRLSGGVVRTGRGRCATRVACVSRRHSRALSGCRSLTFIRMKITLSSCANGTRPWMRTGRHRPSTCRPYVRPLPRRGVVAAVAAEVEAVNTEASHRIPNLTRPLTRVSHPLPLTTHQNNPRCTREPPRTLVRTS